MNIEQIILRLVAYEGIIDEPCARPECKDGMLPVPEFRRWVECRLCRAVDCRYLEIVDGAPVALEVIEAVMIDFDWRMQNGEYWGNLDGAEEQCAYLDALYRANSNNREN